MENMRANGMDRRRFLTACSAAGVGGTMLPGVLLGMVAAPAMAEGQAAAEGAKAAEFPAITAAMIDAAAVIAGLVISDEQKKIMLDGLTSQREDVLAIRKVALPNAVAPAMVFDPLPVGYRINSERRLMRMSAAPDVRGVLAGAEAQGGLCYATVRELAELVRARSVTSTTLTRMYIARLKQMDSKLHCVVTLTEERAMKQAAAADAEIAAGRYRGPLHGIPWGGKDLLAVKGYPTTWGAGGFETQTFDEDAEVVKRLDAAGAVLIAKLSMGALAQGDLWFGGRTRNPWNVRQGSSGSSAGSASAASAGCVGFAIGTETLGSISSPSTRCGVTGLRPTFGFVPRTGAMALSWSMDKIGAICRSVEDCALVLSAIHGPDGRDKAVHDAAFNWDAQFDWKRLKVGYVKSAFDLPKMPEKATDAQKAGFERRMYDAKMAARTLDALRGMGVNLIPVEIPEFPYGAIVPVLEAEAAAAFDELTRSGRDKLLNGQLPFDWPNQFRVARFYSGVDYVQAMRARTVAIAKMAELFAGVDVIVAPSQGAQLTATNLTGHPAVIVPNGLRGDDAPPSANLEDGALQNVGGPGTPVSVTFLGRLYEDAKLAAFAKAYQDATGFHKVHPKLA